MMIFRDLKNWKIFNVLDPEFESKIYMTIVFGDVGNQALIVTNDKMVYGLGYNVNGCLGIGDTRSNLCPVKINVLSGKDIKTFAYGKTHVLALTEQGLVYSWGNNNYGQLGIQCDTSYTPTVVECNLFNKCIKDVACGSYHSLALTTTGEVYTWGNYVSNIQTTTFNNIQPTTFNSIQPTTFNNIQPISYRRQVSKVIPGCEPRKVNFDFTNKNISSIACGDRFSMVITNTGEVYGWGENGVGQLGIGTYSDESYPHKVTALHNCVIEKIVCGYSHTLALSTSGILYVWGGNSYGQLGLGTINNANSPMKLEIKKMGKVWDVATSYCCHISVAIGEQSQVYIWGQCLGQTIRVPTCTPLRCLNNAFAYYAWPNLTYQPLIFYNEKISNLKNTLNQVFDDPTTSDFIIKVQEKSIYVHKVILKIRCQHFRTMFQKFWAEDSQSIIQLEHFSYDVYRSFLKYLYTDEIDLSLDNKLVELLELANMYFESQLKRRCTAMLIKKVSMENIVSLYSTSVKYNLKELERYCSKFALNRMTAFVQTPDFAELDKNILRGFLIKAAQAGVFKT